MKKPLLCRLGFHVPYHYLPKVGGDLGEISIACKRCGYGYRYFEHTWDIPPAKVQESIKRQAEIEWSRVLSFWSSVISGSDPLYQMQIAYDIIKDKFSVQELEPIIAQIESMKLRRKQEKAGIGY